MKQNDLSRSDYGKKEEIVRRNVNDLNEKRGDQNEN